jgi:hypothetical protein
VLLFSLTISMAANKFFKSKQLGVSLQRLRMLAMYPHFKIVRLTPSTITWIGQVQPSMLSEIYTVRIRYKLNHEPVIVVLSPALKKRGDEQIHHIYAGEEIPLCLYHRPYGEWHPGKYIADTIVPWTSLWLRYYETWHATGIWLGGGMPHKPQRRRRKR